MLNKEISSTIFKDFGMTRLRIKPRSPGPLANTLATGTQLHVEGEKYTLSSMLTFPSTSTTTTTRGTPPQTTGLITASPESQPLSSDAKTQFTDFSQIPKINPPRTLPVHDVIHTPWSHFLSGIYILTSLNDTSSPRAREHLRSCCT